LRFWLALQWAAGWIVCILWLPIPAWLALFTGAVLAALAVALVLALEFLLAAAADAPAAQPRRRSRWDAWLGETAAHLRAFWLLQPFYAGFAHGPLAADPAWPCVLLIHGFGCNRAMWLPLVRSGRLSRCNLACIDLAPACVPIEEQATIIDEAVRRLRDRTGGRRVALIAHSMGGLAVLAYLARFGDASVQVAITLATPFEGTWLAHLRSCPAAIQMRPGNRWLTDLIGATTPEVRRKLCCVATRDDNVIIPWRSALMAGARHYLTDGVGHLALSCDYDVAKWALEQVESGHSAPI